MRFLLGLGLCASLLVVTPVTSARAADPVTLNLLGVNDFHGRINANTVKWAGTVEQLTEAGGGDASTLLVGAGDLIGASEYASAIAEDQPTIDMFNELGLDASAVGNHEFDYGYHDLTDRVVGPDGERNAQWAYLGANVYDKGTTTPALPEYAEFTVQGVDVAVIGAVTEETATLVNSAGIEDIDFGDPIEAVNRVAGELSDGNDANGEAQVIIASFHAGASVGAGSTYDAEVAKGGEFAEMADLDPAVDVILNGHTHQTYAWDAPVPGAPGVTRPILQTGEYGTNVGQVSLTVDPATGDVVDYTAQNVPRTTTSDADLVAAYPRVAKVQETVDAALAHAAEVGNEPVGSVTADISRAYNGASEDRGAESTLGDLVGDSLREGVPARLGHPDIGFVNPGGLRADLLYGPDGVVTYAEANTVQPFLNNIWLVDLAGADFKEVLEQQYQTNPGGPTPSRPYLQAGLSANVRVTTDPTQPAGSRITSVRINDKPLDPDATYTVSTYSYLALGNDLFRAFTNGTHVDTGLIDRDLWIAYLRKHPGIAPDFARQEVTESGMPQTVAAGDAVTFTLSKLDLTSTGSPQNSSVSVYLTRGTRTVTIGDFPVTGGAAAIAFTAPAGLDGDWQLGAVAKESRTVVGAAKFTKATSKVTVGVTPKHVVAQKTRARVHVSVTTAGTPASGNVEVRSGGRTYAARLVHGKATITLQRYGHPGQKWVRVTYLGNGSTQASYDARTIQSHHRVAR